MSYLLPKRISELATIDSDLDTPDKTKEPATTKNAYWLPKRVADLELQESDSEDDKNDKLNCAILNESFVLTPSKDLELDSSPCSKSKQNPNENDRNVHNQQSIKNNDSGVHSSQDISGIKCATDNPEPCPVEDKNAIKMSYRPIKARAELFPAKSVLQEKPQEVSVPSVFQKCLQKPAQEPVKPAIHRTLSTADPVEPPKATRTPFKKADEPVFITPSVRPQSFSLAKLNRQPHSTESDRKEKPQAKILFTTPIARPPPGSLMELPSTEIRKPPSSLSQKLPTIQEPSPEEQILIINGIDYVIKHKIGSGGSSQVFLACRRSTGVECALKFVNLDGDQQVIDGYLNETKLLARLQGNINVVSLFDYCHLPEKNLLYMVMEKGDSDFQNILINYRDKTIPLYKLLRYWHQMLQAVHYIHQNGVIHSDLKPANFLMIAGRLKLIDFGIASNIAIDSTSIIKFSQAGTFNYISPEALIDTSTDSPKGPTLHHQPRIRLSTKSDVWSLGCILYYSIYKRTPFSHIKGVNQKIQTLVNPNTVIEYPPMPNFYPPILLEMVKKCLVYNPKSRSSVADLLKYPFEMMIPV